MNQWHHERMNAYSEDLRQKIIQALRRGMGKSQAARTFGVSLSSVKRYAKMADEGRPLAPKEETRLQTQDGPGRQTTTAGRPQAAPGRHARRQARVPGKGV
jgi:transposase-like protein